MTSNKKAYMREYVKKNRDRIRAYKAAYMRRVRAGKKLSNCMSTKPRPMIVKKGHCDRCDILLTSQYAERHDGKTCGPCIVKYSN